MLLPLFLNDVAGSEIIVIILVVLIFFGSKSIPGIAKTLGKTLYQIKNASAELQNEIKKYVLTNKKWSLNTDYHFGGYAKISEELIHFINK